MAKRKSGALKTAKFPPPSPFRKNEDIEKANVAFGDLEFEAAIQDYVKDSPVALLALQDINKKGGISKFIKALQKGDKDYFSTIRGQFFPKEGDRIEYNATDILDFLRRTQKGIQPHPIYGEYLPTKEKVKSANLVQSAIPVIAHELFHYGTNVLRKQGYDVPKIYEGRDESDLTDRKKIRSDILNEEAIIDQLERLQRRRLGMPEDIKPDYDKAARDIRISMRKGKDRSQEDLLGKFKRFSGYDKEENPFRKKVEGFFGTDFFVQEKPKEALNRFESMALEELEKRNYARTKEPMKDTREKSFLEKLSRLNPFREEDRPIYREGGVVNMLKKMK